jgi:DNA-binding MarR family transcriptional regulator
MDMRAPSGTALPPIMRDGGELSLAAVAALCGHPRFPAAMRAMMNDNVRLFRGNRILNYLGYDRGRLIVGILALSLHASRRADDPGSGLTAQRLKTLCVEQDLCSAGRARAMLSLLRLFGYVAPAEGSDGRYKLLAPTELLITFLRERWSAMFDAIALIAPEGAAARAALSRDDFLAALARAVAQEFRTGIRALERAPELEPFAEHNAGLMILSSLVVAGEPDDTMPPSRPIKLSISELARRFSVSRAHVLRLLRAADAQGLIKRSTGAQEAITLTPPLSGALRQSVALLFLFYVRCARIALADVGRSG